MAGRNGYFQLDNRSDGCYVVIYPPGEGGKKVDVRELVSYLEQMQISGANITELNSFIQSVLEKPCSIKVSAQPGLECNESMTIKVSEDRMMVYVRFHAPSTKGSVMDENEILSDLEYNKIQYGISEKIVKKYVESRLYCTDIPIAKGKAVVQGKDAYFTYHFDINPTSKPKQLEDGSVDFHQLNIFTRVAKGDLLVTLTPADLGEPGMDVYGNQIMPAKVKQLTLKASKNIVLSEDKLQLYSEVDGDVKLEGDNVYVSDTYYVPADVDTSTGDIHYDGNVVVTGNVRTGFTIRAKGSVQVDGVVEGACIYSGDSIVLKRGMQGMSKGYLEAEKDIVSNFVESGTLIAKNNITVGSLLHSKAKAGNDLVVSGKKAFIIGGEVEAGHKVDTRAVGNQMETMTIVRVGVSREQLDRLYKLKEENESISENVTKYNKVIDAFKEQKAKGVKFTPDQVKTIQSVGQNLKVLDAQYQNNEAEIAKLNEAVEKASNCCIQISDVAHVGSEFYLNGNKQLLKESIKRCKLRLKRSEIEVVGY